MSHHHVISIFIEILLQIMFQLHGIEGRHKEHSPL